MRRAKSGRRTQMRNRIKKGKKPRRIGLIGWRARHGPLARSRTWKRPVKSWLTGDFECDGDGGVRTSYQRSSVETLETLLISSFHLSYIAPIHPYLYTRQP